MQIVRSSEELARARVELERHAGAGADDGRAPCRTSGADRRSEAAGRSGRGDDLRQSGAVRRRTRTSPAIRDARRRMPALLESAAATCCGCRRSDDIYPAGFATTVSVAGVSDRWEGEARPGPLRRRRHRRCQAAAVGSARCRAVRRKGLPATGRHPPDGRGPCPFRSRSSASRPCGSRTASPCPRAMLIYPRDERSARAGTVLALSKPPAQRSSPGSRSPERSARGATALLVAGFSSIDYFAWSTRRRSSRSMPPAGDMRLIAAATIGTTRLIDNLAI